MSMSLCRYWETRSKKYSAISTYIYIVYVWYSVYDEYKCMLTRLVVYNIYRVECVYVWGVYM